MNVVELGLLAENGVILSASIVDAPLESGFLVHVAIKNRIDEVVMTDTRHGKTRVFKSIDSAVTTIRKHLKLNGAIQIWA